MNCRNAPKLVNQNRPNNAGQAATIAFAYAGKALSAPALRMFQVLSMQKNGFHPSAKWLEDMANIKPNKQSQYRKELIDKGFVIFYNMPSGANVLMIQWDVIKRKATEDIPLPGAYNNRMWTIKEYGKQYKYAEGVKLLGDKKTAKILESFTPSEYDSIVSSISQPALPF